MKWTAHTSKWIALLTIAAITFVVRLGVGAEQSDDARRTIDELSLTDEQKRAIQPVWETGPGTMKTARRR